MPNFGRSLQLKTFLSLTRTVWRMCQPTLLKLAGVFVFMFACGGIFAESKCLPNNCELSDRRPQHKSWDYLQFVVQWPQSVCLRYTGSRHHHPGWKKCIIPSNVRNWTIHGTWPTRTGTTKPQNCNDSWTFNLNDIKDLLPEMNQSWPNLLVGDCREGFWKHEWFTHGTCCASLPAMYGEHNYFSQTLEFKQKFDIDNALRIGGIVPSSSARYNLTDIQQAIRSAMGVTPNIICFSKSESPDIQYLQEIRLCLQKTFEPRDCPISSFPPGNSSKSSEACLLETETVLPPIP